jgi:hypothetical protein
VYVLEFVRRLRIPEDDNRGLAGVPPGVGASFIVCKSEKSNNEGKKESTSDMMLWAGHRTHVDEVKIGKLT